MELFIIRHGESTGNVVTRDMPDAELTGLGRRQALAVAERMRRVRLDRIIASPLVRAIETARPLARALRLPVEVWKNTYEVRSRGFYKGPALRQLREWYPEAEFKEEMEPDGWIYPGDETAEMGHSRAGKVYAELCRRFGVERVALFAHGGFNRHLLLAALGLGPDSAVYFHQGNGCVYWLSVQSGRTRLEYLGGMNAVKLS